MVVHNCIHLEWNAILRIMNEHLEQDDKINFNQTPAEFKTTHEQRWHILYKVLYIFQPTSWFKIIKWLKYECNATKTKFKISKYIYGVAVVNLSSLNQTYTEATNHHTNDWKYACMDKIAGGAPNTTMLQYAKEKKKSIEPTFI